MFGISKLKKRVEQLETFEKSVCKIIDNYFHKNEKKEEKYSTDNAIDRFYSFVQSVDTRLRLQAEEIEKLRGGANGKRKKVERK